MDRRVHFAPTVQDASSVGLADKVLVESARAGLAAAMIELMAKSSWFRSVRERS